MTTKSPLPGIKVLLIGGSGVGKTTAIKTLLDAGVTPMCIFTENGYDVLGEVPAEKLHWKYIPPVRDNLAAMMNTVKSIGLMTYEQLTKMQDPMRAKNDRIMPIYEELMNFTCQRTGKNFGNISTWGTDRALVIDSLSGLCLAAVKLVIGERPAMAPPDYQVAQGVVSNLVNYLCTNEHCHFVMMAHAERELDPVFGGSKIMASGIGKALSPILPRYFTDVILAKRTGTKFFWDTADAQSDLKGRNCPISADLPPSFAPLIASWKKRGGVIETPAQS